MSHHASVTALARATLVALACTLTGCFAFHGEPLPAEKPEPATRFATVAGVALRVREEGPANAPAVVLIHGYGSSLDTWRAVVPKLADRYRVVAVDLKGFGRSARPDGDYSPSAQAALMLGLMDQLGLERTAVVGHSWGASVALTMALVAPERVTRVAVYGGFVFEEQIPPYFRWAQVDGLGELVFAMSFRERPDERLARAFYDPDKLEERYVERVVADLERPGTLAASLAAVRGMDFASLTARLGEIRQPALLLWGREDRVSPPVNGERLVAALPYARLTVYPRCGHFPHVEALEASTRALIDFLAEAP